MRIYNGAARIALHTDHILSFLSDYGYNGAEQVILAQISNIAGTKALSHTVIGNAAIEIAAASFSSALNISSIARREGVSFPPLSNRSRVCLNSIW